MRLMISKVPGKLTGSSIIPPCDSVSNIVDWREIAPDHGTSAANFALFHVMTIDPKPASLARPPRNRRGEIIAVAVLLVLALFLRFNLRQGNVSGLSMEPGYSNGDTVLVWRTFPISQLKPRDVIIFRDKNGDELIKRVAFIRAWQPKSPIADWAHPNGGRLIPAHVLWDDYFDRVASGKQPAPSKQNTIYVLGDNLVVSDDSRHFGPISPSQVLGKVIP